MVHKSGETPGDGSNGVIRVCRRSKVGERLKSEEWPTWCGKCAILCERSEHHRKPGNPALAGRTGCTKFAERAKKIANEHIKENGKELIVIRRFEIEDKVPVPRTHTALKKLIQSRLAFEFHHKLFPAGHTIEALWEWFRRSDANRDPYVWEIPYKLVL
ncbi:hypothetical protein Y032_0152g2855 [Ancylostoma ceylanicum]|uniref:Uncharacterized protein n=1 Tax=Ancylostoma ceylanicum TaxID=53326 RepID=A0A016SZN4_9BILA|nr:hypothetical protein Y032_0152g2855 [Ancylostoma ceylanicum]